MIKIKEPIRIKSKDVTTCIATGMAYGIAGNYEIMNAVISGSDLLHACTTQPDIFLAEGNNTSIFNNTNNVDIQQNKLEIINQVINRLMVAPNVKMSYQDVVYITAILNKLGIKNHQEFIGQVRDAIKELHSRRDEIHFLEQGVATLQKQKKEDVEQLRERVRERIIEAPGGEEALLLHESIANRLMLNQINDIVVKMMEAPVKSEVISPFEMVLSEQRIAGTYLNINRLERNILGRGVTLVHKENNIYEREENLTEMINEEHVSNRLTAAVLYNLIRDTYSSRMENIHNNSNSYYQVSRSLYNYADNTINRYKENLINLEVRTEENNIQDLQEQLKIIEQHNIEKRDAFIKAAEHLKELKPTQEPGRRSFKQIREEGLSSLENPQKKLFEYRNEAREQEETRKQSEKSALAALDPEVRSYFEMIDRYVVNPGPQERSYINSTDPLSSLVKDISEVSIEHRTLPESTGESDRITVNREEAEHIVSEVVGQKIEKTGREITRTISEVTTVPMTHKIQKTINEDEIIETIRQVKNTLEDKTTTITGTNTEHREININNENITRVVQNEINDLRIEDLVRNEIVGQVGDISDKVFNRIERRLESEKARRGF